MEKGKYNILFVLPSFFFKIWEESMEVQLSNLTSLYDFIY